MKKKITQSINKSQEEFEKRWSPETLHLRVGKYYFKDEKEKIKSFLRQSNIELLGAVVESLPKKYTLEDAIKAERDMPQGYILGFNSAIEKVKSIIGFALGSDNKIKK